MSEIKKFLVRADVDEFAKRVLDLEQLTGNNSGTQDFIGRIHKVVDSAIHEAGKDRSSIEIQKPRGDDVVLGLDNAFEAHKLVSFIHQESEKYNNSLIRGSNYTIWFQTSIAAGEVIFSKERKLFEGAVFIRLDRLEKAAEAGECIIDEYTYDSLDSTLQQNYEGPNRVQGKQQEVYTSYRQKFVSTGGETAPKDLDFQLNSQSILDEDPSRISPEDFQKLFDQYSDQYSPASLREAAFDGILLHLWSFVVNQPYDSLTAFFKANKQPENDKLSLLVSTTRKLNSQQRMTELEICTTFDILSPNTESSFQNIEKPGQEKILKQIIRSLLYIQPNLLIQNDILPFILPLIQNHQNRNWNIFWVDILLRHKTGSIFFIAESSRIIDHLNEAAHFYRNNSPSSPIAKVWELIEDPILACSSTSYEEIIARIKKAAQQSQCPIESKWCMAALFRTLSLVWDADTPGHLEK